MYLAVGNRFAVFLFVNTTGMSAYCFFAGSYCTRGACLYVFINTSSLCVGGRAGVPV